MLVIMLFNNENESWIFFVCVTTGKLDFVEMYLYQDSTPCLSDLILVLAAIHFHTQTLT